MEGKQLRTGNADSAVWNIEDVCFWRPRSTSLVTVVDPFLLQLFDFGFPEGVPPLNPEGSGPSLYDLEGNSKETQAVVLFVNWQGQS